MRLVRQADLLNRIAFAVVGSRPVEQLTRLFQVMATGGRLVPVRAQLRIPFFKVLLRDLVKPTITESLLERPEARAKVVKGTAPQRTLLHICLFFGEELLHKRLNGRGVIVDDCMTHGIVSCHGERPAYGLQSLVASQRLQAERLVDVEGLNRFSVALVREVLGEVLVLKEPSLAATIGSNGLDLVCSLSVAHHGFDFGSAHDAKLWQQNGSSQAYVFLSTLWRGGRVVECGGLEILKGIFRKYLASRCPNFHRV